MNSNNPQEDISSFSSIYILLVDDNKVNQFLGKKILKNLGYSNVEVASDGKSALEMLQDKNYHVLLTDVEMPGMSGYELTTAVRNLNSNVNAITIIALTANATAEEKEFALKNGMNDYLAKPYSPNELQEVLQKHVRNENSYTGFEFTLETVLSNNPVAGLYSLFNHNKEDVRNLLLLLQKQLPESMTSLKNDILADNNEAIFNNAHKLKSTIKLFNDDALFRCISDITEFARTSRNRDQIPSLYDELNKGVSGIMVLINIEIEML
ncbi:MAG: response regulator [Bacteroidota bacterium]